MSHSAPTGPQRSVVPDAIAVCALLLGSLSVAAYLGHGSVLEHLGRRLSRAAGAAVEVDGLHGRLSPPAIVIEGLRIGETLDVERVEARLDLGARRVRGLRMVRPRLRLDLTRRGRPALRRASGPGRPAGGRLRRRLPAIDVQDGRLDLVHGPLALSSRGIYVSPRDGQTMRLVLGPTRVLRDGQPILGISATAVDLSTGHGFRPARVAALGASVHLPGSPHSLVGLHRVSLVPALTGYRLDLEGKTAGRRSGRFEAVVRVDHALRPDRVTASLHDVDLTALEPLLEPLGLGVAGTRASGELRLTREHDIYRVQAGLELKHLVVQNPMIAARRVGPLDTRLDTDLSISAGRSRLQVHRVSARIGEIALRLAGDVSVLHDRTRMSLALTLGELPCQEMLASLPAGFAPALTGMAVQGQIGAVARLKLDTADLPATEVDLDLDPLSCRVVSDPPFADVNALRGEVTINVSGPRGRGMQWPLGPSNPDWKPLSRISRHVRSAFVVAEDGRFYRHDGFDREQLQRAVVINLEQGRLLRGASTISQQLIKNIFLSHRRTLSRKFQEAVLTWRLEQVVSKRRILELYLNLVEMGPGVYGVGQAARHYFDRPVARLTPLQAAHLAALTPSPRQLGQRFRQGLDPGMAWAEKLRLVLRLMRRAGSITREQQRQWSSASLSLLRRE